MMKLVKEKRKVVVRSNRKFLVPKCYGFGWYLHQRTRIMAAVLFLKDVNSFENKNSRDLVENSSRRRIGVCKSPMSML